MRTSPSSVVPCCPTVLHGRLKKAAAEQLGLGFEAIADPGRLQLLNFIAAQPLGRGLRLPPYETARREAADREPSLKVLYDAGLLAREQRGTWVYYRTVPERLAALRDALAVGPAGTAETDRRAARVGGKGNR